MLMILRCLFKSYSLCCFCYQKAEMYLKVYLLSRYGMRYMAKVLKAALEKKFPEAAEKDVLKVNGNDFFLDIACL